MAKNKNKDQVEKDGAESTVQATDNTPDVSPEQQAKNEEAARMQADIDRRAAEQKSAEDKAALEYAAKLKVEREEMEKLRPLPPVIGTTSAATAAAPGEETVLMQFPRPVVIWAKNRDGNQVKVQFQKGVQHVPVSMKDNHYLKDNGVLPVE